MSLVNRIMSGPTATEPEVGMGATVCMWSDRNPATIVEVLRFKSGARKGEVRGVVVREDRATVISGGEHDGSARYTYTAGDASEPVETYLRDARGRYVRKGGGDRLSIGTRERYRDPSF